MFTPQYYMRLNLTKDHIILTYNLFGMVLDELKLLRLSGNRMLLFKFFEKYKNDTGILIQNDRACIEIFMEIIDDGLPVPGFIMLFENNLFLLLSAKANPNVGITRVNADKSEENENIFKIPDIRKLLEKVQV